MARPLRLEYEGAVYHDVKGRGNRGDGGGLVRMEGISVLVFKRGDVPKKDYGDDGIGI